MTIVVAVAIAILVARPGSPDLARRRLAAALPGGPSALGARGRRVGGRSSRPVGAAGLAVAVGVTVGGAAGIAGAVVAGALAWWVFGRLEPVAVRRRREQVRRDLPFAADLLSTCLAAGAPPPRAFEVTGTAVGGPIGSAFSRTAAGLALGAAVAEAVAPWKPDPALAPLEPVARLLLRAESSGTGLAGPIAGLAADLRAERRWRIDAVARRAGVRATAPLGVCFLPAFVLLGVAPVVLWGMRSVAA